MVIILANTYTTRYDYSMRNLQKKFAKFLKSNHND